MARKRTQDDRNFPHPPPRGRSAPAVGLRIVGGQFRGRRLEYGGDTRVRPMKDRVREALFNLVGPAVRGMHAIDLFAGTGALALEALSRGAARATLIEQHYPTAAIIRRNLATLGVEAACRLISGSAFAWAERDPDLGTEPWLLFSSPPYAFYVERQAEMLGLLERLCRRAPAGSIVVVESDERLDHALLPAPAEWDVRRYPPAIVAIWRKADEPADDTRAS